MRDSRIVCDSCGRTTPRSKAAPVNKRVFGTMRKVYFCISCAKHRGIGVHDAKNRVKRGFQRRRRSPRP